MNRTNSYIPSEIETPAIAVVDIMTTANPVENTSTSSSSSSISNMILTQQQQQQQQQEGVNIVTVAADLAESLKSAPKKSFLNRSTSQNGAIENQIKIE